MTADSGASNVHAEYVGEGMITRERGREMSFSIAQTQTREREREMNSWETGSRVGWSWNQTGNG